jgi:hypothetical protein
LIEIDDGIIPDNIAYYVEGTEGVADTLKIKINVNDSARSKMAQIKLIELAKALSLLSLKRGLSEQMKDAILQGKQYSEKCGNKNITFAIEKWASHRFNGCNLKFVISSI